LKKNIYMGDIGHNCGIYLAHRLDDLYYGLKSQGHRGREAFGIAAIGDRIDVLKAVGTTDSFKLKTLNLIFNKPYHTFIGHLRYATKGSKGVEQILKDAHPITIGGDVHKRDDHLIIEDCRIVGVHNGQVNDEFFESYELGELKTGTDTEKLLRLYDKIGEKEILRRIPGSFTTIIADRGRSDIIVMRDRSGIKPGVLGKKAGKYVVASEDSALTDNNVGFIEELRPGWVYYISPDGTREKHIPVANQNLKHCFFEWNYIARADSTLNDLQVRRLRRAQGVKLAQEFSKEVNPNKLDFVTFIPDCPEEAAIPFGEEYGIPVIEVFYKRDKERSFQGSDKSDREYSIRRNLQLAPGIEDVIRGKTLAVIDDSVVRGVNSRRAAHILNRIGRVRKAYLLNYTPEIGIVPADGIPRGCMFGVDMPPDESPPDHVFIARNKSPDQISREIGMDTKFISVEGMLDVYENLGVPSEKLCTYCIGGNHPFEGLEKSVDLSIGKSD
jgi:amidophosphoribosyltransferase